jgi:hypothetical protein
MSEVKLNGAFVCFFHKTEISCSLRYFSLYTVTAMSTSAVAGKKIHAEYFWSVGGSYTNKSNQLKNTLQ